MGDVAARKGPILVGLSNPGTMPHLLATAKLLAEEAAVGVVPVCVLAGDSAGQGSLAERLLGCARKCACEEAGLAEVLRVEADSVEKGILRAAEETKPSIALLGYSPPRAGDNAGQRAFARLVHRVAARIKCHLIVAKFGEPPVIRRVLLPLASQINIGPIGNLARALTLAPDSELTLAHVLPDGASTAQHHAAAGLLRSAADACGVLDTCQFRVQAYPDLAEGILEMAAGYDGVILGSPRARTLTQRIFGIVDDQVAAWAQGTVFIVRARG